MRNACYLALMNVASSDDERLAAVSSSMLVQMAAPLPWQAPVQERALSILISTLEYISRNIFIKSLKERNEQLVSPKQRGLLRQAAEIVESWRKKDSWSEQNQWVNDFKGMLSSGEFRGTAYDLRDVADWWFQETKVIQQKVNSSKSRKKSRQKLLNDRDLKSNLKQNEIIFEDFLNKFGQVNLSQPIDSRMISVIFAWPKGLEAPKRVQAYMRK